MRRSTSSWVSPLPAANSNTANLARQVGPATSQARQLVFELRQLDLCASLARARLTDEEIEDEGTAIDDCTRDKRFQVSDLIRRQIVVEDHDVGARLFRCACDLARLSPTNKRSSIRRSPVLHAPSNHLHSGTARELRQLVEVFIDDGTRLRPAAQGPSGRLAMRRPVGSLLHAAGGTRHHRVIRDGSALVQKVRPGTIEAANEVSRS